VLNFESPYSDVPIPTPDTLLKPSTLFVMDNHARPTNAQDWNLSIQREVSKAYTLEARYVGTKGTHVPRNIDANPAVYGPGANAQNEDHRRIYANCPAKGPCDFVTIAELQYGQNSTYHAAQLSFSRQAIHGLGFNVSYWYSKTLDYLSSMNLQGASSKPLGGENDLAQNPFDLKAEHGPSLFDARHRFVASGSWQIPFAHGITGLAGQALNGWQLNLIGIANSATPYTVYDSANETLQASAPPVSGYPASRPNVVGNPNRGPHTVAQWIDPANFSPVPIDPAMKTAPFGNAGRNIARGPDSVDFDVSAFKNLRINENLTFQFRAESFNVANHPNFGLPIADIRSTSFSQIIAAAPPRLTQFALKAIF
jgi:hypothetical protein